MYRFNFKTYLLYCKHIVTFLDAFARVKPEMGNGQWGVRQIFSFATMTAPQRIELQRQQKIKNMKNVNVSASKWSSHNEYMLNAKR